MPSLDELLQRLDTLPPAPHIVVDLLGLLLDDEVPSTRVVELITYDPALTAKVLQRCNAAAAGLNRPVHDLEEAILLVGFNEVFRLVLATIGEPLLGGPQVGYGIAAGELWRHSAVTAVGAQIIARARGDNENLAFTAALLHDVGKVVLGASLEEVYADMVNEIEQSHRSLVEAEQALLHVDHAEIGGRLLAKWQFPEDLVNAVWHHHDPHQAGAHERLAAYASLGDLLAHLLGHGHGYSAFAVRTRKELLEILTVQPNDVEQFILDTHLALQATPWFAPGLP